jgi:peptidyl-tRNA hydrolase
MDAAEAILPEPTSPTSGTSATSDNSVRPSPHFTPPTPGTPAATPTEASGAGTPAAGATSSFPGLDVNAVAAALAQATARPISLMRRDEPGSPPPGPEAAIPERVELERLYAEHNPAKLGSLDSLLEKYGGPKLLAAARKKYGAASAPNGPNPRPIAEGMAAAVKVICEMGFDAAQAQQAMLATGCTVRSRLRCLWRWRCSYGADFKLGVGSQDVQLAISWLLTNSGGAEASSLAEAASSENVKMVIAVRQDLGMGAGKVAAQVRLRVHSICCQTENVALVRSHCGTRRERWAACQVAHGAVDLYRTLSKQDPASTVLEQV